MTEEVVGAIFGASRSTCRTTLTADTVLHSASSDFYTKSTFELGCSPLSQKVSELYTRIDLIVDSFEIRIERPKNPVVARKCWTTTKRPTQ